jgi:hypothetical protein
MRLPRLSAGTVRHALNFSIRRRAMNVPNMPGFTAEASIYRTRSYREVQVDGVRDAFEAVEAQKLPVIEVLDVHFETPFGFECNCSTETGNCYCKKVITA